MPQLIRSIQGEVNNNYTGTVIYVSPIIGQIQQEDYIGLNGFIAYLQNLTMVEYSALLIKPLNFGLANENNIDIETLNISY